MRAARDSQTAKRHTPPAFVPVTSFGPLVKQNESGRIVSRHPRLGMRLVIGIPDDG